MLADPALYEVIGGEPPTLEELRTRLRRWAAGRPADGSETWLNWLVRFDGEVAGYVQATIRGDSASIAYVIGTAWQGRGIATAATRQMIQLLKARGVQVIEARIQPQHLASARVVVANGLEPLDEFDDEGEQLWRASGLS